MSKEVYSTIEIAKLLHLSRGTITRWIDNGELKAYSTLGGHRRVKQEDLIEFVNIHNMPLPGELSNSNLIKVLIVDDDEQVLSVLSRGIEQQFHMFDVYTASSGFDAGNLMERLSPDVVILDIFLPGEDGNTVCKKIKTAHPETRIIAITGQGTEEVKEKIMAAGAEDFIEKPFDVEEIVMRVRELTKR